MNRKLIFLLLLGCLLTPLSVRAAEPVKFFCVELRDGTKAEFALSSQPQITFSNGSMTAITPEKTITVELGRVLKYFFSSTSTGISLPSKQPIGKPQVEYHIGHVLLYGLPTEAAVSIMTIDGRRVFKGHATADGKIDIDLSTYSKGIYLLCTPNGNIKMAIDK